ncbi:unnamed protein product [Urochloa humidicola]
MDPGEASTSDVVTQFEAASPALSRGRDGWMRLGRRHRPGTGAGGQARLPAFRRGGATARRARPLLTAPHRRGNGLRQAQRRKKIDLRYDVQGLPDR